MNSTHRNIPLLVKQRCGAELRNRYLASLNSEISQALTSLHDELRTVEDIQAMCIGDGFKCNRKGATSNRRRSFPQKSCVLYKAVGRMSNSHDLIDCRYLINISLFTSLAAKAAELYNKNIMVDNKFINVY